VVPLDSALVAHVPGDGKRYGRYVTVPIEVSERCVISAYSLGEKTCPFHVEVKTFLFWREDWLLQVHVGRARQACQLTQGTYAMTVASAPSFGDLCREFVHFEYGGNRISFQNLFGYESIFSQRRGEGARSHSHAQEHVLLTGSSTLNQAGRFLLASISGAGKERQLAEPWQLVSAEQGQWKLVHPISGEWGVCHPDLPSL
jgi:hypothetical protein